MSEFRGEMKTLVQTYVELLYPDDLEMQTALFENITTGKASVTLEEMQDYVATRSSWYAEIEAVNPAMAVVHNQNDEFVGTVEVMDMDEDPDGVEVFINDEQMNEISSTHLYEDDRFWEDYDAETFEAGGGLGKNQRNLMQRIIEDYQRHDTQYAIVRVKTSKYCDGYTPRMLDSLYRKNMIKYLDNEGNPDIGFKVIDLNPYQLRNCPAILVKPTNMALQMNAETFNAERKVYVLKFSDPMRGGKVVEIPFLSYEEAQEYIERYIRPYNDERIRPFSQHIATTLTEETRTYDAENFNADFTVAMDATSQAGFRIDSPQIEEWNMTDEELKEYALQQVREGYGPDYWIEGEGDMETLRITELTRAYPYEPDEKDAENFNAMSFKQWSQDEMNEELHGGQNMDFDSWLNDEIRTHGNIPLRDWGYEEEHDEPEHQHAESMMSEDYMNDEEILRAARNDIDNQISRGTFYTLGQEPQAFHDGEIDGENFYTIISLYCQYAEDEDRCEKKLQDMFKKDYAEYMGDESFYAESMMSKRGKVRTLSGKPHKARKLKKDRYITPEEAKTRLSFRARKGIDTFAEPFEEIGDFYSGAKGILKIVGLGALVSVGVWITKNKLLE